MKTENVFEESFNACKGKAWQNALTVHHYEPSPFGL